jgi:hypothetical protein
MLDARVVEATATEARSRDHLPPGPGSRNPRDRERSFQTVRSCPHLELLVPSASPTAYMLVQLQREAACMLCTRHAPALGYCRGHKHAALLHAQHASTAYVGAKQLRRTCSIQLL